MVIPHDIPIDWANPVPSAMQCLSLRSLMPSSWGTENAAACRVPSTNGNRHHRRITAMATSTNVIISFLDAFYMYINIFIRAAVQVCTWISWQKTRCSCNLLACAACTLARLLWTRCHPLAPIAAECSTL